MEAKISTGSEEYGGWFAGVMAIIRRLIMKEQDWTKESAATMQKTMINIKNVDEDKAKVILSALREYEANNASTNLANRRDAPAGKAVADFILEAAAMIKRLFMPYSVRRHELACNLFEDALEDSRCFYRLGSANGRTVLRFCQNCREEVDCKINLIMAKVMTRAIQFARDFNGHKGGIS